MSARVRRVSAVDVFILRRWRASLLRDLGKAPGRHGHTLFGRFDRDSRRDVRPKKLTDVIHDDLRLDALDAGYTVPLRNGSKPAKVEIMVPNLDLRPAKIVELDVAALVGFDLDVLQLVVQQSRTFGIAGLFPVVAVQSNLGVAAVKSTILQSDAAGDAKSFDTVFAQSVVRGQASLFVVIGEGEHVVDLHFGRQKRFVILAAQQDGK